MTFFSRDAIARVLWTAVQVLAGVAVTKLDHANNWWAVSVAGGIVVIKTFAMTQAMRNPLGSLSLSVLERLGWTAAQAALGLVVINRIGLPVLYTPIAAAVLAAMKSYVGKHVGSPDTAATLPAMLDPGAANPLLPAPAGGLDDAPPQPIPLPPHPVQSDNPIPGSMVGYDPAAPAQPDMPAASSDGDAPPPEGDAAPAPAEGTKPPAS